MKGKFEMAMETAGAKVGIATALETACCMLAGVGLLSAVPFVFIALM